MIAQGERDAKRIIGAGWGLWTAYMSAHIFGFICLIPVFLCIYFLDTTSNWLMAIPPVMCMLFVIMVPIMGDRARAAQSRKADKAYSESRDRTKKRNDIRRAKYANMTVAELCAYPRPPLRDTEYDRALNLRNAEIQEYAVKHSIWKMIR